MFEAIDDAAICTLKEVDFKGEKHGNAMAIDHETLLQGYSNKVSDIVLSGMLTTSSSKEWSKTQGQCVVILAIDMAFEQWGLPDVTVLEKPKGVYANATHKKTEMVLIPATTKLKQLSGDCDPDNEFAAAKLKRDGSNDTFFALLPDTQIVNPASKLSVSDDPKKCNMERKHVNIEIQSKFLSGKAYGDTKVAIVSVPMFINTKKIEKGVELVLFAKKKMEKDGQDGKASKRPLDCV